MASIIKIIIEKDYNKKYFKDGKNGRKHFEVRLTDFDYKINKVLIFKEQKDGIKC